MNHEHACPKSKLVLLGSVGLNIFLVAFLLGRASMPGLMPPPPPFGMGHHPMHMASEMPPPPPPGGPMGAGEMPPPPPPPFFGPADLFSPEEMKEDFTRMQANFEKIRALRQDFAKQLTANEVTKEDVLKHFAAIDQLMDNVKKQTQEKAAAKISAMTPQERKHFADRLLERD